jgi:ribosomal protein S18 acetylase RimI-like enzyme
MKIRSYSKEDYPILLEIFTANATVEEISDEFRYKYLDYYLENGYCFVAEDESVLGYICGLENINQHSVLFEKIPYLSLFKEQYETYPTVLHINMSNLSQGKGLGSQLIEFASKKLKSSGCRNIHLITAEGAANVSFYQKNSFIEIGRHNYKGSVLLMLSKNFEEQ